MVPFEAELVVSLALGAAEAVAVAVLDGEVIGRALAEVRGEEEVHVRVGECVGPAGGRGVLAAAGRRLHLERPGRLARVGVGAELEAEGEVAGPAAVGRRRGGRGRVRGRRGHGRPRGGRRRRRRPAEGHARDERVDVEEARAELGSVLGRLEVVDGFGGAEEAGRGLSAGLGRVDGEAERERAGDVGRGHGRPRHAAVGADGTKKDMKVDGEED